MSPIGDEAPAYCRQESSQTLAEGLEEYYRLNEGVAARPETLPSESAALFRSHDACHVIFGLTTSPVDEAVTNTRAMVASTVGWRRYAAYLQSDAQAKAIFKEFGALQLLLVTLAALPRIARALFEAIRMRKRWPWTPPQSYFSRTLAELRREHRIRLI